MALIIINVLLVKMTRNTARAVAGRQLTPDSVYRG
jgi:hypothetical protein